MSHYISGSSHINASAVKKSLYSAISFVYFIILSQLQYATFSESQYLHHLRPIMIQYKNYNVTFSQLQYTTLLHYHNYNILHYCTITITIYYIVSLSQLQYTTLLQYHNHNRFQCDNNCLYFSSWPCAETGCPRSWLKPF